MLTQAAYARQRGCSKQYIGARVKAGDLVLVNGMIDPQAADEALARTADPTRDVQAQSHAERRGHHLNRGIPGSVPLPPEGADDAPVQVGRYVETPMSRAKARDAEFSAKLKQAEYERMIGKLVESSEVVRALSGIGPALTQLDGIPDRLTARMRAAPDERSARALLADELLDFRQTVAEFCRALAERLGATAQ